MLIIVVVSLLDICSFVQIFHAMHGLTFRLNTILYLFFKAVMIILFQCSFQCGCIERGAAGATSDVWVNSSLKTESYFFQSM